jgi:hypothetical protein
MMTFTNEFCVNIIKYPDTKSHPYVVFVDEKTANYCYENRLNSLSCDDSKEEMC